MALTSRVLVTGGAGFIGSNLVEGLCRAGARVRVIDNFLTGFRENLDEIGGDFDLVEGDINDDAALDRAIEGVEVVFHQAALPSVPRSVDDPTETHQVCLDGTFNLLLKSRNRGVRRFIYAASSSAYGNQPTLPKVETMKPDPLSPYAVAKLAGELYCRSFHHVYGLETMSLRYFNVFGPRQNPASIYSGVISRFVDALMTDSSPVIFGDGTQSRDFTYVDNVVDANIKAAQATAGLGQSLNVANGERITLNDLLEVLKGITGRSDAAPVYEPARPGDVHDSQADNTRAVEWLGYSKLVGLEEGLRRTVEWWKASRFAPAQ
jgi:nucleoside-diphosphate-sugar epimerase